MSINEEIWSILSEGRLVELRTRLSSDTKIRSMYLAPDLYEEIFRKRSADEEIERFTRLQADLDMFLTSETIDPEYLFQLTPTRKGVWEIRSTGTQIRVFGLFCGRNKFIATHYKNRDELGNFNDTAWKVEIRRSLTFWSHLFPAYSPLTTSKMDRLISGAINGQYFK